MKIGVCAGPEQLPLLESLGFDYFEANFSWLAGLDEETYREKTALVEASTLRAEAFNGFFPGGIKLYAPDGNQEPLLREVEAYCEKGFARAASWGGQVAVIGSGYVRGIPEGMTWEAMRCISGSAVLGAKLLSATSYIGRSLKLSPKT